MSDSDPLRRYIEAGIALTQLTRARAEAIVKELVKAGEIQREQAQDRVEDLLERSRKGTGDLASSIRSEIAEQLSVMGFATKADLAALEARLTTRFAEARGEPAAEAVKRPEEPADTAPAPATAPPGTAARKAAAKRTGGAATGGGARAGRTAEAGTGRAAKRPAAPAEAGTEGAAKAAPAAKAPRRRSGPSPTAGGG